MLEQRESLEQLRALENDMRIFVEIVDAHPLSVDTKQDLEIVSQLIAAEK
jgi:3-deoxy-manno-octulosonate cytidylyltransferase (CMP-KDO synthetase)